MISNILGFLFRHLIIPAIFLAIGWYGGARYGAPELLLDAVDGAVARATSFLTPVVEDGAEVGAGIVSDAVEQSSDYVVGTVEQTLRDLADVETETPNDGSDNASDADGSSGADEEEAPTTEATAEPAAVPTNDAATTSPTTSATTGGINGDIVICAARISNPPRSGKPGETIGKSDETATYKGVTLMLKPATKSCLSSGFGYRNGKLHKGVDYYSDQGGDALAAGDGVIVEKVTRADYGNMLVIDHGNGVYTRYAHLAQFASGLKDGADVKAGQILGPIGNSGASSIVHLHYEVLTGDIATQGGSFGLEAIDPFGL